MERTPANTDPVRSEQQRQDWTSTIFVNPLFNLKTGPASSFFSTFLLRLDQPLHPTQGQGWTSTILLLNPISSTVGLDQCTSSQTSSSITWLDPVLISILFSHPCSPTGLSRESITCFTPPPLPLSMPLPLASGCSSDNS